MIETTKVSTEIISGPVCSSPSLRDLLRHRQFRGLWAAGSLFFVGNAMLNMAVSWKMLEVTGSDILSALVQTASFLPMFLLSLPGGVLADTVDRRRLMLFAQTIYALSASILTAFALSGFDTPALLFAFTFVLGACAALQSPSWNSAVADSVARAELPQAVTFVSMSYNAARAVGPALAGLMFASMGSGAVFSVAVVAAIAMSYATNRWPPPPPLQGGLPSERLWAGSLSAIRYARYSPAIFAQLLLTAVYSGIGSALWALLPMIAQRRLELGAAGYGVLMGCLGMGAVAVGPFVGRVRAKFGFPRLAVGCSVVFALCMCAGALITSRPIVYGMFFAGGAAWMAMMSSLSAAAQTSASPWVRARVASMHNLCSLGALALGSAVWGVISDHLGVSQALCIASASMLACIALAKRFPLQMGSQDDATQASVSESPLFAVEPDLEAGPVAVEIVYRIRGHDSHSFLHALRQVAVRRRRDGATFWRIYRDLGDHTRYVERFIVTSWGDYLRQRSRTTVAGAEFEACARKFQVPEHPVVTRHYLAERG